MKLLNHLDENKNGQHHTHQCVQTHQGAQQGENNADDGDLCQQTDDETTYDVDQHVDDEGNDKGLYVSCLESGREKLLQNIHFVPRKKVFALCLCLLYIVSLGFENVNNKRAIFESKCVF